MRYIFFFCFGLSLINLMANWRQRARPKSSRLRGNLPQMSQTELEGNAKGHSAPQTQIYIYICEVCMCELTIKPPNHGCRNLSASPECNNIVWCPEKSAKNKSKIKNKRMKKKKPTETYINYTDEICAVLFLWAVSRRQDSCFL